MAMNTIYKWLAESINAERDYALTDKMHDPVRTNQILDDLANSFANKMEPKQPGSFDKQKFLEMAGVKLPS